MDGYIGSELDTTYYNIRTSPTCPSGAYCFNSAPGDSFTGRERGWDVDLHRTGVGVSCLFFFFTRGERGGSYVE